MKCYKHQDIDAVGICKHCQRGLCVECAVDLEFGLACSGIHEREVEFIHSLVDNSKKAYKQSPKSAVVSNLFYLLMGVFFIVFGYRKSVFLLWFGILCIAFWLGLFIYNSNYFRKIRTNYES